MEHQTTKANADQTKYRLTFSDPQTRLKIVCTAIEFKDFPAEFGGSGDLIPE